MASTYKEVFIEAPRALVWDAVRDIGALHTRLVPGFVVDTKLEPGARVVTFGNGMVMREPIVSLDDERCRLVWGAQGGQLDHYNAALQLFDEANGTRVSWTSDFLPDAASAQVGAMQDQALATMKRTLEQD